MAQSIYKGPCLREAQHAHSSVPDFNFAEDEEAARGMTAKQHECAFGRF